MRLMQSRPVFLGVSAAIAAAVLIAAYASSSGSSPATTPTATAATVAQQSQTLQTRFVSTVKKVSPSVVVVETSTGLGSGVVIDRNGDIVTNHHVVGTSKSFAVTDSNGKRFKGTLVGSFAPDDLAVIHVTGAHLAPLTLGNSAQLQMGDIVMAIGNPLGLQSTVTQGIVSALGRTVTESNSTALPDVIQTSAAINPGNSGGALVNLEGQVVGIPTLTAIDPENSQIASGIGFAIPSNTVKAIATQIIRYGHVVSSGRAFLGANLSTTVSGGVAVSKVVAKGPAATAGIVKGDTITSIDGLPVTSADAVAAALANLHPSSKATFAVRTAAGTARTIVVTLGTYPVA
jgi:putative serine protease PepD